MKVFRIFNSFCDYFSAAFDERMKKEAELELAKIEREAMVKGKMERENQDLILERIRLKAKERREQAQESIK